MARFFSRIGIAHDGASFRKIVGIYFLGFIYTFVWALPLYLNSSLIETFFPEKLVGVIFAIASAASLIALIYIPKLLRRYGHYRVTLWFLALQVAAFIAIAFLATHTFPFAPLCMLLAFIALDVSVTLVFFVFDILLEQLSHDSITGSIRGYFLTLGNTALIIAPFLAGFLLADGNFWKIYFVAAVLVIVMLCMVSVQFKGHPNPPYRDISFFAALKKFRHDKNLYNLLKAYFLLFIFYVWMVVYIPLYLHNYIGLPYNMIVGIIIPIALIPFPLFETFLGLIADKYWGEKELLMSGFLIASLGTMAIPFIDSTAWWVWATVLFITRIGASFIELTSESYFYKHVDSRDVSLVSIFRMLSPLSYITAAAVATVLLYVFTLQDLFFVLGAVLLLGIYYGVPLTDTK